MYKSANSRSIEVEENGEHEYNYNAETYKYRISPSNKEFTIKGLNFKCQLMLRTICNLVEKEFCIKLSKKSMAKFKGFINRNRVKAKMC